MKAGFLVLLIFNLMSGCYWAHEDDILPTSILEDVVTPKGATPRSGAINALSRAAKKFFLMWKFWNRVTASLVIPTINYHLG